MFFFYKAPLAYTTVIIKAFASSKGTMAREQILQQVEKQSGLRGLFYFCLFLGKQTLRKLMFYAYCLGNKLYFDLLVRFIRGGHEVREACCLPSKSGSLSGRG